MTTDTTGTGSKPNGDGSQVVVQPADESQGSGDVSGGESIPKARFIAALNNATAKTDALQREVEILKDQLAKASEKKPATIAELKALVASGDITQDQADLLEKKELKAEIKREVVAEVGQTAAQQERARRVQAELSGYREVVPDVWEAGTPDRAKVDKEFKHLVNLGYDPKALETEAAALRAAFGDLEILRKSKSAKPGTAETHTEVGGGKPSGDGGGKSDAVKGLTPRQKEYYEGQIKAGRYKDWGAVKAELEYDPRKAKA